MLATDLKETLNKKSNNLYGMNIDELSLSFKMPNSSNRNASEFWNLHLSKLAFLLGASNEFRNLIENQIEDLKMLKNSWKSFSIKTVKEIAAIKKMLAYNGTYKRIVSIDNTLKTFPIVNTKTYNLKFSVSSDSVGYYGTTDPELNTDYIYFEAPIDENCKLVLDISLDSKLINLIELEQSSIFGYEPAEIKSIYVDGVPVDFVIVENLIYLPPIAGNVLRIVARQTHQYLNSNNEFVYLIAINKLNFKLNQYEPLIELKANKTFSNPLIGNIIFDIVSLTNYDLLEINGTINNQPLDTTIVSEKAFDVSAEIKTKDIIENISSLIIDDQKFKNEIFPIYHNGNYIKLPVGKYISKPYVYQYGLMNRSYERTTYLFTGNGNQFYYFLDIDSNDIINATILVDNVKWSYVSDLQSASANDLVWTYRNKTIMFGDGTHGKAVPDKAIVKMRLDPIRVNPSVSNDSYYISIPESFDPDIKNLNLYGVKTTLTTSNKFLSRNSKIFNLPLNLSAIIPKSLYKNGSAYENSTMLTEKEFNNGNTELTDDGDYSVDYENGVLYLKDLIKDDEILSINFSYYPTYEIKKDLELWVEDNNYLGVKTKSLPTYKHTEKINDIKEFISQKFVEQYEISGDEDQVYSIKLSAPKIIKGSVKLNNLLTDSTEVEYRDGLSELLNLQLIEDQLPAFSGSGQQTFLLKGFTYIYTYIPVSFTDKNTFASLQENAEDVDSYGKYFVNYETGVVTFWSDSKIKPFIVSYYIYDLEVEKLYSIDYENGILYSIQDINLDGEISYETANLFASYQIVKPLEYELNGNSLVIHTSQLSEGSKEVKCVYQYNDISSINIKDYYTPILNGIYLGII